MTRKKPVCEHGSEFSQCKLCKREYDKVYNAFLNNAYKTFLKEKGCFACGFNHPNTLHVHHLATEFKRYGRSQGQSANLQDLESNKAMILCANCHDLFHGAFGGKNQPFPLLSKEETKELIMKERNLK